MANPKRASMREGPLAALFRKTEEGEETQDQGAEGAPAAREEAAEPEARVPSPQ